MFMFLKYGFFHAEFDDELLRIFSARHHHVGDDDDRLLVLCACVHAHLTCATPAGSAGVETVVVAVDKYVQFAVVANEVRARMGSLAPIYLCVVCVVCMCLSMYVCMCSK